jgi:hypothetical protein
LFEDDVVCLCGPSGLDSRWAYLTISELTNALALRPSRGAVGPAGRTGQVLPRDELDEEIDRVFAREVV